MMSHIGYDQQNNTLSILFHSGKRYNYDNVPAEVFDDFLAADSKGRFFNSEIDNLYSYRLVKKR